MPRSLFISDLHLDSSRPATIRALDTFLHDSIDADALYILGDLFEAWLGDDDDSPLARDVTALLRRFSDAGPHLYLMQGNRDFLLGERLCQAVGATFLADPVVIDLYGTPTLLMHGDSLCTADVEYQSFRNMARDPAWQADLLSRRHGLKRLIHGHTHRPATHRAAAGERWVLGDWDASGWYIEARPDHIELHSFNIIQ
jgi:UDP-2,3-diacylglucosamine hydrolase